MQFLRIAIYFWVFQILSIPYYLKNVPYEKGVKDVKCDLTTKEVTVQYQKDKNNNESLKRSIEKLGYTAKEVTEKKKESGAPQGNRP